MSLSKMCCSSQFLANIKIGVPLYQYTVEIIFKQPGKDGNGMKSMNLSENKNNDHKHLCRMAIKHCDLFHDIPFAYDGRKLLWSPAKLIENSFHHEWLQPDLPEALKQHLVNPNGILQLSIKLSKDIILSNFDQSVHGLDEDRTWRNILELAISEHSITREIDQFILTKSGHMFESVENVFHRGLMWRSGHKKAAQIIKDRNGQARMCITLDCCKKAFFPNDINFLDFFNEFVGGGGNNELDEIDKLCSGMLLSHVENERRILHFEHFIDGANVGDLPQAAMSNTNEIFALDQLIIRKDQQVCVNQLSGQLKDAALELNRFEPAERKRLILEQFHRLGLNNAITESFGITVDGSMLRGSYEIFPPMTTEAANGVKLFPFPNGSFKLHTKDHYKRAQIDKIVVLASKIDYQRTIQNIKKLVHLAKNQSNIDGVIHFQEFNLYSEEKAEWLAVAKKIKAKFGVHQILVLAVDGPYDAHYFLKYIESQTELRTQQVMTKKIISSNQTTFQYISHKMNVKMGGLNLIVKFGQNARLDLNTGKILVIALDVCHATGIGYNGATLEPSSIGLSANYLQHPQEFGNFFFFGPTRGEVIETQLLIPQIEKIMLEALERRNQIETIVFIRDGVDEGRYSKVIEEEVAAIKAAAKKYGINAKVVVFLITKRITTRHLDESSGYAVASLPSRSFVNFGTRYAFKIFFMSPHRALSGTSVSIQVTMLYDEIGITKIEAQEFLLALCYLHQIVNSPISIPSPLHNADEIALRGQYLFRFLKRFAPNEIPLAGNGEIDFTALSKYLNFGLGDFLPGRHNA